MSISMSGQTLTAGKAARRLLSILAILAATAFLGCNSGPNNDPAAKDGGKQEPVAKDGGKQEGAKAKKDGVGLAKEHQLTLRKAVDTDGIKIEPTIPDKYMYIR